MGGLIDKLKTLKKRGDNSLQETFPITHKYFKKQWCHLGIFFLKNENSKQEDYEFSQELSEAFKLKTSGDLHNLYMISDTMLLADVFESFR